MELSLVGIVSALATFSGIAFGHILVRWLEYRVAHIWMPFLAFLTLGFLFEFFSYSIINLYTKIAFGILGITFLWDAVELFRQQRRVRRGHAPANPRNPRHRWFLESPGTSATTIDFLRDEIYSYLESRLKN